MDLSSKFQSKFFLVFFVIKFLSSSVSCQENRAEFVLQISHNDEIISIAFSPDGKILATGSQDNSIKIWDIITGALIYTFEGHLGDVISIVFSPDGKILASASEDKSIKLWNIYSGELDYTLNGHSLEVTSLSFSSDGKNIISGSFDKTIKIWGTDKGKLICEIKTDAVIHSLVISADGKTVISGNRDNTLKQWNLANGTLIRTFKGHSNIVTAVVVSLDGKYVVSGSNDNTIKLWDICKGTDLRTFKGHTKEVNSIAISSDCNTIISGSSDKKIIVWDAKTGKQVHYIGDSLTAVNTVTISRNGQFIAFGSGDQTASIWDIHDNKLVRILSSSLIGVNTVAVSPNSNILASGNSDNSIRIWDLKTGKLINTLKGQSNGVDSMNIAPDGTILVYRSGKPISPFLGHSEEVSSLAFSVDGKIIVSGSYDSTVKIWDVISGKLINTLKGHSCYVSAVAISPDGKTIVSGDYDETLKQWDVETGKLIRNINWSRVYSITFSNDGKSFVTGSDGGTGIIKWDVNTGKQIRVYETFEGGVYPTAISPDENEIASINFDNTLRIWKFNSGELIRYSIVDSNKVINLPHTKTKKISIDLSSITLMGVNSAGEEVKIATNSTEGHLRRVACIAYSPDGKLLATGSEDKKVRVWDNRTGKMKYVLDGHSIFVNSVAFTYDGNFLITSGHDCICLWKVEDGTPLGTIYSFGNEEYLTVTSQGYYVCSPEAEKHAGWKINGKVYDFKQYADQFNKSEFVHKIFTLQKDIIVSNVSIENDIPPILEWINKHELNSCTDHKIVLFFRYVGKQPWRDIDCLINNQVVNIPAYPEVKETAIFKIPIELGTWENNIIVTAKDNKFLLANSIEASISCEDEVLSIRPISRIGSKGPMNIKSNMQDSSFKEKYNKKHAIVIGISSYKNLSSETYGNFGLTDLKYCHKDAESFRSFLLNKERSGGDWDIKYLVNDSATSRNVDDALSGILMNANANDLIFIFFSGHGRNHPSKPDDVYLLTSDFKPDEYRSGFDYSTLRDLIISSKAKHIITFLDACKTGIVGFKGGEDGILDQNLFGKKIEQMEENKIIFTSGRGSQVSWEDDSLKKGVFTHFLIKGLNGEAPEVKNPSFVDMRELADYVTKKVEKYSKDYKRCPQVPQIFESRGLLSDDFPVAIRK